MDENPYKAPQTRPYRAAVRPLRRATRFIKAIVPAIFVVMNTIACGCFLWLAGLGLSGRLADAGIWENQGYGMLFLLGALVAGVDLLALFPEHRRIRALRWSAYTANTVLVAAGFYTLWGDSISPESLYCWGLGSTNIVAIAVTGE